MHHVLCRRSVAASLGCKNGLRSSLTAAHRTIEGRLAKSERQDRISVASSAFHTLLQTQTVIGNFSSQSGESHFISSKPLQQRRCQHAFRSVAEVSEVRDTCKLAYGICSSPPAKKEVNEDAWILYDAEESCTIGIIDGISSWRRSGVKAEIFSNQLACNISVLADKWCDQFVPSPLSLLDGAYEQMIRNKEAVGSCTVSVGVVDKVNHLLNVATLGDCGFRVIRNGKIILKSEDQYVSTCVPYQLGILPQWCEGNLYCKSFKSPTDANCKTLELQNNDSIVFGSDGLFDNIWDDELLTIIEPDEMMDQRYDLERAAKTLVFYAHRNACGDIITRATPHAHKICGGCSECLEDVFGGNIDDVTACIAHVKIS